MHQCMCAIKRRRARLHSPILMLLGKLEHEHQPSKLVSSKARLGSMFSFAFAKMSRIPNKYISHWASDASLYSASAAISASKARYNDSARTAQHRVHCLDTKRENGSATHGYGDLNTSAETWTRTRAHTRLRVSPNRMSALWRTIPLPALYSAALQTTHHSQLVCYSRALFAPCILRVCM